ncbi:hypothetical protein EZS27_025302 [termite gut metagenome]|uniref:TonB-dependent receptor SusC n=1 Tax=termite gut metagenome TaxID=433724 RepID=A0A5J4QVF9_9ZZZZ
MTGNGRFFYSMREGGYADCEKSKNRSCLIKYSSGGVIQFLLLDKNMNPLSERLAFCFHDQTIHTTFQTDKQTYGIKEEIKVDMLLSDYMQKPVEGNLSVSITDSKDVPADTCFNILTNLLLTSDLKGYIETPSFYFQKDNEKATQALDLLMLTQGWRRYDISSVIAGRMRKPEIKPETSFNISGRIKEIFILSKRKEYVLSISGIGANFNEITEIGKDGHFSFEGIEYPDGVGFSLQAIRAKGGSNQQQSIQIDGETLPEITSYIPQVKMPEDTIVAVHSDEYIAPMKNGMRGYMLDAVEVKAIYWGSTDYDKFSNEEINDPSNKDVRKFIQDMGIKVVTRWGTDDAVPQEEFYYKGTEVIAFIDDKFYKFGYGRDIIYDLSLNDIEEIIFLKNVDRGIVDELLMERGYYDVHTARKRTPSYYIYNILENKAQLPVLDIKTKQNFDSRFLGIYFRDGKDAREWGSTQNRKTIYPLGYQRPVEFYSPKYDTPEKKNDKTEDLRRTIFWKPDIKTDQEGTSFSFYSSDTPTTYSVVIEGLSDKGDIIYEVKEIKVK